MEKSILKKLTDEEINIFIAENERGNTNIAYIKTLDEIEQEKIKDYLKINHDKFIEINSKEQFLKLLKEKENFNEYESHELYNSIFIFPFYVTKSLLIRVGGSISKYGHDFSALRCNSLEFNKEIRVNDGFFGKKNKILLGITQKHEKPGADIPAEDYKIYNEIEQIRLSIISELNEEIKLLTNNTAFKYISELDKNSDGEVDLLVNDFNKLLSKNQKKVIEIDKNYIHQLIKVSNYIKAKRENIQKIFISIKNTKSPSEIEERVGLLKNQIHTYELLLFNSINMICSIVDENLIVFYEIYESFDKLGIFNSNWENEVSEKLTNIEYKLEDLMLSINEMESNIVKEISNLSYVTQSSFRELNHSVSNQLKEIESSINFNNLLTGIQTYQLYKINKNTKTLNN